jgi:hypothetical protein
MQMQMQCNSTSSLDRCSTANTTESNHKKFDSFSIFFPFLLLTRAFLSQWVRAALHSIWIGSALSLKKIQCHVTPRKEKKAKKKAKK